MKRLVLIDGHAILHRAYHAFPSNLKTRKGELVNAVYGFTRMLLTVILNLKPECIVVTFDEAAPNFRHKAFVGYQADRPKTDQELTDQIDRVKEVVEAMNIPIFSKAGFEADDVIGTLARQATESGISNKESRIKETNSNSKFEIRDSDTEVIIVTGDRDILQLVNDKVKVYMPERGFAEGDLVDKEGVKKRLGIYPELVIDYKALVGDQSDNYPGVLGIGPKTAINLLEQFGSLDRIYANLDKIVNEKVREKLKASKEDAYLSKKLATIVTDAPVKLEIEKCRVADYDQEKVLKLFDELEFRSLRKLLPGVELVEEPIKKEKKVPDKNQQSLF
jgi:DNA polymerase I